MTIPEWLRQHLTTIGAHNTDGISRTTRPRTCRTCHTLTLTGLDADRAGLPVRVDPQPLTPLGEAMALTAGRRTYEHNTANQLNPRSPGHIAHHPAATNTDSDVHASHLCGTSPLPTTRSVRDKPRPPKSDRAPF